MLTEEQRKKLAAPLDPSRVGRVPGKKTKDGKPVGYLEAWDDIETANEIFGFDGWSRETVTMHEIHPPVMREDPEDPRKNVMVASYWAKVRITVFAGDRAIVREGCGGSTSYQKTVGEAVENAIKGAESDAMKRAFVTFGNQFGLALYDKTYKNVRREEPAALPEGPRPAAIDEGFSGVGSEPSQEPAPPVSNSTRALATLPPRPAANGHMSNGHAGNGSMPRTNGGLRY